MPTMMQLGALSEHPLNQKIYFTSEEEDKELEDNIEEFGIQHPIIVNEQGRILSGHRRYKAAVRLGLYEVPVEYKKFNTQDEELQYLITANMYRSKAMEEKIREAQMLKDIMARKGEKTRDAGGKLAGVSGRTYSKAEKVIEEIDAIKDSDPERAQLLRDRLNKSVDGAYNEVKNPSEPGEEDFEEGVEGELRAASEKRKNFYYMDLMRLTSYMEAIYQKLAKMRGSTTPGAVGHMIGNIYEMKERLMSWTPKRMEACLKCQGTSQIKTLDANQAETIVSCDMCVDGKVGLFKESRK